MAHIDRKSYWIIFVWLFVLTILEVMVAWPSVRAVVGDLVVAGALVAMAIAKAMLVGLYYMHLNHEKIVLKLTVLIPMVVPMLYALILIAEAAWRYLTMTPNAGVA